MQNLKSEITGPKFLYLVTGGAGFIGSNIVERLVQQGERACPACPVPRDADAKPGQRERRFAYGQRVRVLDNLATGKRENLAPWLDRIELIEGDVVRLCASVTNVRDAETVKQAMEGVSYVLHQAALPSVPRSIADPLTTHQVNATGTLNVLLAAREAGVKRLVYASSSLVYGDSPELPKREDMPTNPLSP